MSIESRHLCPRAPVLKLSPGLGTDSLSGAPIGTGQHAQSNVESSYLKPQRGDMFIEHRQTNYPKPQRGDICRIGMRHDIGKTIRCSYIYILDESGYFS